MSRVQLKNVVKTFTNNTVLKGLNLEIEDGAFMVMIGSSGCGKSTALRCIAGLETVSSGTIMIGDEDVTWKEPKDRNIAMVFQNYALYPHMNVFDNITYGLKVRGLSLAERQKRAQEAANLLGLDGLLERMPRQLSGGQRQRVAMGRAIVRDPNVFLFDEPLSNLDANLRNQMRIELRKLHQRLATTSIYVTHDQVEAMTLADQIVVLNQGKIEQCGSPEKIYNYPASVFVARFMGSPTMNTLPCITDGEQLILPNGTGLQAITADDIELSQAVGRNVVLGIRPEDLYPDSEGPLRVRIDITEELGADTIAYCHVLADAQQAQPLSVVLRLPGSERPQEGQEFAINIRPNCAHVFDQESGLRLSNT